MYVCTIKQYVLSFTQAGYGQALFDTLAHRIYLLLEQWQQYQHYLSYLDIFPLPLRTRDPQQQQLQPGGKLPAEVYVEL